MGQDSELRAIRAAVQEGRPILCVVVDTEEEFDWSAPLARANRSVTAIPAQARAQAIFARYGVRPTYVVDHPVASTPSAAAVLRGFLEDGACEIGAHLHPWVNPPDEETVTPFNSYAGNLPADLERRKLTVLTETITQAFGRRPRIYKAGRYGLGPSTPGLLADLGYCVDTSVVPYTTFSTDGGPDFTAAEPWPGPLSPAPEVMELPLSVGFTGGLRRLGSRLQARVFSPAAMRLRLPGILARSGLLERIRLTPEGARFADHKRVTETLLSDGLQVLVYTYHSPSLEPGCTPYVRTDADLKAFLGDIDRYCDYVLGELGGVPATPMQLYALWREGDLAGSSSPLSSWSNRALAS